MIIIGVDFHPEFQQIASVDTDTGEFQEKRLAHREDAETFYRTLAGQKVRVGMEASGHAHWFEGLVAELRFELWDRRRSRDPREASTQAEDGSPGRATDPTFAGGGPLPADLVSSSFRAHYSMHSEKSAISLSLKLLLLLCQPRLARNQYSGPELGPTHASLRSLTAITADIVRDAILRQQSYAFWASEP